MKTSLIAVTATTIAHKSEPRFLTAEELIVYCARVSNPSNQENVETGEKLLKYCLSHSHWSVFETASMTVEIETSRAIAAQILRHRSFTFQEFSQRYSVSTEMEPVELRSQDTKNRQGSGETFDPDLPYHWGAIDGKAKASVAVQDAIEVSEKAYKALIAAGVSKETARMVLPLCTRTRLYMTGSVRSWIHYFEQRCSPHAQKEHRLVAESIRDQWFKAQFPIIHGLITKNEIKELRPALEKSMARSKCLELWGDALYDLLEAPEKNCSCHIITPCNDCVENEGTREAKSGWERAKEAA